MKIKKSKVIIFVFAIVCIYNFIHLAPNLSEEVKIPNMEMPGKQEIGKKMDSENRAVKSTAEINLPDAKTIEAGKIEKESITKIDSRHQVENLNLSEKMANEKFEQIDNFEEFRFKYGESWQAHHSNGKIVSLTNGRGPALDMTNSIEFGESLLKLFGAQNTHLQFPHQRPMNSGKGILHVIDLEQTYKQYPIFNGGIRLLLNQENQLVILNSSLKYPGSACNTYLKNDRQDAEKLLTKQWQSRSLSDIKFESGPVVFVAIDQGKDQNLGDPHICELGWVFIVSTNSTPTKATTGHVGEYLVVVSGVQNRILFEQSTVIEDR